VLVVEDDADAAATLALLLRGWGHDVEVAADGVGSLDAARAVAPDAVLFDLDKGDGLDGLEVDHRLWGKMGLHDARLMAVTARPMEGAGAGRVGELDGVLIKPVEARALREALTAPAERAGGRPGKSRPPRSGRLGDHRAAGNRPRWRTGRIARDYVAGLGDGARRSAFRARAAAEL
jgi:CheY-like chemotaxis protein